MRTLAAALLAVLLLLISTPALIAIPAAATDGSVPAVVADYIATDLADALNEFYGPGTDGDGILFEDSTAYSSTSRVWAWTAEFEAGIADEPAERRLNEWVTVVSVREVVVGVATVSIDPVTNGPQLAHFLASPELAAALGGVGATSRLLRDIERGAWLAVEGETVSAVVAGRSGITEPTTVAAYRARVAVQQPEASPTEESSSLLVAGIAVLLVVLLLGLWRWWSARVARTPEDHVL